ncbi:MAG: toll/interleukin-1 receptor domain-containing protein [Candidatus Thiodiazotropha sp. L084R]
MPDVFISYSVQDEKLARFVRDHLLHQKLDVFLASISLEAGHKWTPQIFQALKESKWVFFLASECALKSNNVQQELGAALITEKKIVPIMWDIEPSQLPVWISQYQGLCLKGQPMDNIRSQVATLSAKVKADKIQGMWVAGAMLAGIFYLLSKQ